MPTPGLDYVGLQRAARRSEIIEASHTATTTLVVPLQVVSVLPVDLCRRCIKEAASEQRVNSSSVEGPALESGHSGCHFRWLCFGEL